MSKETVVIPALRIPRRLWLYLEALMEKKMFTSISELVRDALREYVERHKHEIEQDFKIITVYLPLKEVDELDNLQEKRLIGFAEKLCSGH